MGSKTPFNAGFSEFQANHNASRPLSGGYVTPHSSGVAVDVAAVIARVVDSSGTVHDCESAGSSNLSVSAGSSSGQSKINNILIDKDGTISAAAGTSAVSPTAPAMDETTYALIAQVTVANGATGIVQGDINNTVRRLS